MTQSDADSVNPFKNKTAAQNFKDYAGYSGANLFGLATDPRLDPTHAFEQVAGKDTMDDTPGGRRIRAHQAEDAQQATIDKQNAADATTEAQTTARVNAARLDLLSRQGFGSTVLSGPGLLGRQATLG